MLRSTVIVPLALFEPRLVVMQSIQLLLTTRSDLFVRQESQKQTITAKSISIINFLVRLTHDSYLQQNLVYNNRLRKLDSTAGYAYIIS